MVARLSPQPIPSPVLYINLTRSGDISAKVIGIKSELLISAITVTSGRFESHKDFYGWGAVVSTTGSGALFWGLTRTESRQPNRFITLWLQGSNVAKQSDIIIREEQKDDYPESVFVDASNIGPIPISFLFTFLKPLQAHRPLRIFNTTLHSNSGAKSPLESQSSVWIQIWAVSNQENTTNTLHLFYEPLQMLLGRTTFSGSRARITAEALL